MRHFVFALLLVAIVGMGMALGYATGRGVLSVDLVRRQVEAFMAIDSSATVLPRIDDAYEFQLTHPEVKQGDGAMIAVRLVRKRTGEPVSNAVIFARRLDMSPDGMANMVAPLESIGEVEVGIYRFRANIMMEGGWQFALAAKVQGESGTVRNQLLLKAVP
jgi:YtkA-like